ncbi:MAG: 4'-phosphopantetheinyl transferase superfamily protein [Oscillospiraceae bacterium]|nr:4'-phosphopantetheinyl transferase superfamily protein [Oscillospiraceae bacterium]
MTRLYATRLSGRNGSATAYELLEYIYALEYSGQMPDIKKTPAGKPYFPDRLDIHFSLSHSKSHVLCALSDMAIGVDIETARQVSDRALSFFSTAQERELFDPLDLWVLKESYIKLLGGTLPMVKTLHFSMAKGEIIPPDSRGISRLYRIDNCPAAASTYADHLPESIELL